MSNFWEEEDETIEAVTESLKRKRDDCPDTEETENAPDEEIDESIPKELITGNQYPVTFVVDWGYGTKIGIIPYKQKKVYRRILFLCFDNLPIGQQMRASYDKNGVVTNLTVERPGSVLIPALASYLKHVYEHRLDVRHHVSTKMEIINSISRKKTREKARLDKMEQCYLKRFMPSDVVKFAGADGVIGEYEDFFLIKDEDGNVVSPLSVPSIYCGKIIHRDMKWSVEDLISNVVAYESRPKLYIRNPSIFRCFNPDEEDEMDERQSREAEVTKMINDPEYVLYDHPEYIRMAEQLSKQMKERSFVMDPLISTSHEICSALFSTFVFTDADYFPMLTVIDCPTVDQADFIYEYMKHVKFAGLLIPRANETTFIHIVTQMENNKTDPCILIGCSKGPRCPSVCGFPSPFSFLCSYGGKYPFWKIVATDYEPYDLVPVLMDVTTKNNFPDFSQSIERSDYGWGDLKCAIVYPKFVHTADDSFLDRYTLAFDTNCHIYRRDEEAQRTRDSVSDSPHLVRRGDIVFARDTGDGKLRHKISGVFYSCKCGPTFITGPISTDIRPFYKLSQDPNVKNTFEDPIRRIEVQHIKSLNGNVTTVFVDCMDGNVLTQDDIELLKAKRVQHLIYMVPTGTSPRELIKKSIPAEENEILKCKLV